MKKLTTLLLSAALLLAAALPSGTGTAASSAAPLDAAAVKKLDNKYAQINGNLANWGNVASDGKSHFYIKNEKDYSTTLYRYDPSTKKTKKLLNSENIYNLIPVGDWIYFLDMRSPSKNHHYEIYKIKKDGTGWSRIGNLKDFTRFMHIDGGWIYFGYCKDNGEPLSTELYKMKLDGSSMTRLSKQRDVAWLQIWGDWVFFESEKHLYRISKDGTNEQQLAPSARSYIVANQKAYIGGFQGELNKVSIDGTKLEEKFYQATDPYGTQDIISFNMHGGSIYFYEQFDTHIRKISIDGKNPKPVVQLPKNFEADSLYIADNWLYYEATFSEHGDRINKRSLYRMPLNGGAKPEQVYTVSY